MAANNKKRIVTRVYGWYAGRSKRFRDSIILSLSSIGFVSAVFTIAGASLETVIAEWWIRLIVVVAVFAIVAAVAYWIKGCICEDSFCAVINGTNVTIARGDIFKEPGLKVIGCDTSFRTKVDDREVSKKSLHGQLLANHADEKSFRRAVREEYKRKYPKKSIRSPSDFPLGSIVRYDSDVDNETYLLLASMKPDKDGMVRTTIPIYEQMLTKMWQEIDRVYASNDVVLPLLGGGTARFDGIVKKNEDLIRHMLCTLKNSGVHFNANIKIVVYDGIDPTVLYGLKSEFGGNN